MAHCKKHTIAKQITVVLRKNTMDSSEDEKLVNLTKKKKKAKVTPETPKSSSANTSDKKKKKKKSENLRARLHQIRSSHLVPRKS